MEKLHSQEDILNSFDYNGTTVDLVEWKETIWCGKVGYAADNVDEPDVEKIMNDFMATCVPTISPNKREEYWDVCMSINYLSDKRPNGVLFGFRVETEEQPDCYDIVKIPAALYMRVKICDETFRALGVAPWTGGIPPYEWIGERIAPEFGYTYGSDAYPIFEYYGHNKTDNSIEVCYLYVPVQEAISD